MPVSRIPTVGALGDAGAVIEEQLPGPKVAGTEKPFFIQSAPASVLRRPVLLYVWPYRPEVLLQ